MALKYLNTRKLIFQSAVPSYWEVVMDLNTGQAKCRKLGPFLRRYRPDDEIITVPFVKTDAAKFRNDCVAARGIWNGTGSPLSSVLTT